MSSQLDIVLASDPRLARALELRKNKKSLLSQHTSLTVRLEAAHKDIETLKETFGQLQRLAVPALGGCIRNAIALINLLELEGNITANMPPVPESLTHHPGADMTACMSYMVELQNWSFEVAEDRLRRMRVVPAYPQAETTPLQPDTTAQMLTEAFAAVYLDDDE
ncbi:ORF4 protein [Bondarzewia berkeleyi negative-strand RNA virus 1]|uniref:ORF4 protein n=1 Tax=Bondarzewia berkeleyi negative-strand RNA virus 1 TaxID=2768771 RepID=A0AAE7JKL3_9MONO|nr:ORF4 protein [Bondarzewia berkeleyi negative-strand RNA virus 1]QNQ73378.1 ORF4 protein [Bondarzewia berkeleyi negative-strand RNA virus 1]